MEIYTKKKVVFSCVEPNIILFVHDVDDSYSCTVMNKDNDGLCSEICSFKLPKSEHLFFNCNVDEA